MDRIPTELLDVPIGGVRLRTTTLRGELGKEQTLLIFLRHLG